LFLRDKKLEAEPGSLLQNQSLPWLSRIKPQYQVPLIADLTSVAMATFS
jgi:hypothetical protein